ncbi:ABC transporter substrate-binding protein [Roseomonas elaeocarpi]|uniref:ABC transporter substrate-binding protein n=1 Tax=Roseomonas elaeocarpi TaxID=907779 RepID=A0ABV6JMV9_9PROT
MSKLTRIAAGLLSLVLCTGAARAAEMTMWARATTEAYSVAVVKAWNEAHADKITLNLIPNEQFVAKVGTAIAAGSPPDLMSIDLVYVPSFARAEQLTDLTDMARTLPFLDKLSPSHVRLGTFENRLYALPYSAEASVLMFNKALFRRAGLNPDAPPQTWAEVQAAAEKITALGDGNYGYYFPGNTAGLNVFTFLPRIWARGGDILSADGTKATLTDPAVAAALNHFRALWAAGTVPPSARADGAENTIATPASGKVGLWSGGAFTLTGLRRLAPNLEVGATFIPGDTAGQWSSFAGGDSIAIPRGSKQARTAWEFIQWTYSPEVQINILARNRFLPVRTDLARNEFSEKEPAYLVAAEAIAKGRTPYSFVYNDLLNSPQGPFLRMLQRAVFDGDVPGAITEAQKRFEQIIDQDR